MTWEYQGTTYHNEMNKFAYENMARTKREERE